MSKVKKEEEEDEDKFTLVLDEYNMPQKLSILIGNDNEIVSRTKKIQNEKYFDNS